MKKLIAISVVFALVLGAAFAQPSLGGNFKVGTPLLGGQSENEIDEVKVMAGGTTIDSAGVNVNFGDADAGGKLVLFHNPNEKVPGYQPLFAFVWWKPIPQLRIHMGRNADGDFGFDQIAGWGYDSESKSVGVAISQYGDMPAITKIAADQSGYGPSAWGAGFGDLGIALSLYPIDGLQINLGIPYGSGAKRAAYRYTTDILLNASYVLDDIGTVRLGVKFGSGNFDRYVSSAKEEAEEVAPNYHWRESQAESHGPATVWAAFHLIAIEGLGAELGIGYRLPYTTQDVKFVTIPGTTTLINVGGEGYNGLPVNTKVNTPVSLGLGVQYNAGDLGVKARAAFSFAGSKVVASKNATLEAAGDYKGPYYLDSASYYVKYTDANGAVKWVDRKGTTEKVADPFVWGFHVRPSYKLGNITAILNLGIGMKHYAKQEVRTKRLDAYGNYVGDDVFGNTVYDTVTFEGKPGLYFSETNINIPNNQAEKNALMNKAEAIKVDVDWFVNPYVSIPAGGGQFYAGFKLFTDGSRIPVKFNYNKNNADKGVAGDAATDDKGNALFGAAESTKYRVKWEIPIGFNFYF